MLIELRDLKSVPCRRFVGGDPGSILDLGDCEDIQPLSPISFDLLVQKVSGRLVVRGTVEMDVQFRCSRCACFFAAHVCAPDFEAAPEIPVGAEYVDLTADIRETMLLAFPNYPLCRDDCKGLCSQCGADLNQGACGCRRRADNPWDRLDQLRINK